MTSLPLAGCVLDIGSDKGVLTGDNVFKLVRPRQKEIYYYLAQQKDECLR